MYFVNITTPDEMYSASVKTLEDAEFWVGAIKSVERFEKEIDSQNDIDSVLTSYLKFLCGNLPNHSIFIIDENTCCGKLNRHFANTDTCFEEHIEQFVYLLYDEKYIKLSASEVKERGFNLAYSVSMYEKEIYGMVCVGPAVVDQLEESVIDISHKIFVDRIKLINLLL